MDSCCPWKSEDEFRPLTGELVILPNGLHLLWYKRYTIYFQFDKTFSGYPLFVFLSKTHHKTTLCRYNLNALLYTGRNGTYLDTVLDWTQYHYIEIMTEEFSTETDGI